MEKASPKAQHNIRIYGSAERTIYLTNIWPRNPDTGPLMVTDHYSKTRLRGNPMANPC